MVLTGTDIVYGIKNFIDIYILRYSKVVAVVPLTLKKECNVSIDNLESFFCIFGVITVLFLFFKYSRYSSPGWSMPNTFNLMLGNLADDQQRSIISKIVYVILLGVSIFFMSDLISDLTSVNFLLKEEFCTQRMLAENTDEIFQKNLSICTATDRDTLRSLSKFGSDQDRKLMNINKCCSNRSF